MERVFTTSQLMGVRQKNAANFKFDALFLTLFFPIRMTFDTEEVQFDEIVKGGRLAPFVAPSVNGKLQKEKGYAVKAFRPPYLKPKYEVRTGQALKRSPGEPLGGALAPAQRRNLKIIELLQDEEQEITRREEAMAVEAIMTGKLEVTDEEQHGDLVIDYGRSADNQVELLSTAKWDEVTDTEEAPYDVIGDLESWAEAATGNIDSLLMDKGTWAKFRKFRQVKAKLETRRGSNSAMETATRDLGRVVSYKGQFGDLDVWVYMGSYEDAAGTKTEFMPAGHLLMFSAQYDEVLAYGAIQDDDAMDEGVSTAARFPKVWKEGGDPAKTYVKTDAAPLPVLADPDAVVVVKVY